MFPPEKKLSLFIDQLHIVSNRMCLRTILLFLIFLFLTSFFSSSRSLCAQEESRPPAAPLAKVRLAFSYDMMYHESSDQAPVGMLTPLIELLEKEFQIEVEIRKLERDEALQQIATGEIDFFGMIGFAPEHTEKYQTVGPLCRTPGVFASRTGDPIQLPIYIQKRKVGLLTHSALKEPLLNFVDSEKQIVYYASLETMLDALEKKEIDCFATLEGTQIELLRRPDVLIMSSFQNFLTDQGLIYQREELQPLAKRINDYLKSKKGKNLLTRISKQRNESVLHMHREFLSEEIAHIRQHFQTIKMYDSGVMYPLCYKENDQYKGVITDINRIFTQLTDVKVQIGEFEFANEGITAATESLLNGECQVAGGVYANKVQWRRMGLDFSPAFWSDTIRPYSYGSIPKDLAHSRIGIPLNLNQYFLWDNLVKTTPQIYGSRSKLVDDLKKGKLDIVFLGDMALNYQHTVLKDFRFLEQKGPTLEVEHHLVYDAQSPGLNRLFNESIRLYNVLHPKTYENWRNKSERIYASYILDRESIHQRTFFFSVILLGLVVAIILLLWHFVRYDWQIRKLLQKQQTFDLAWGDLRKRRFISKGNHPFFRNWGLRFSGPNCSLEEMSRVFGRDLEKEYRDDMNKMKREGLKFVAMDGNLISPSNGETLYYRRYFHKINDHQFMLCLQDTNTQHESEQQEQFLIQLFDAFKDGLLFIDKDMKVLRYNRSMEELFPQGDPTKYHCYSRFRSKNEPCDNCAIRETFRDGKEHTVVEYLEDAGRWVELNSFPIRNAQTGEVDRVLEFVHDITEQHEREEELKHQKEFLDAILNASNDGIVAISDTEDGTHVNSRLLEMFDGKGASFFSNDTPGIRELHRQVAANPEGIYAARDLNRATQEPQQGTLYFHDGRIYQWRLRSVQTGFGKSGYTRIWTFHDATEEVRSAQQIQENEQRLRTLFETMPSGLGIFDIVRNEETAEAVDFQFTAANQAFEEIIGTTTNESLGKKLGESYPYVRIISGEMQGANLVDACKAALDGDAHTFHVYDSNQKAYRQIVTFQMAANRVGCFVVDETDRITSELALRQSEEKYRTLFDQMPNGLALYDIERDENGEPAQFIYSQINSALEEINGCSSEQIHGKTLREAMPDLQLISEDFEPIETDEHWVLTLGRKAIQGKSQSCLVHAQRNNTYQRLNIFEAGPDQLGIFVTDVTALTSAMKALQESEQRVSLLFASMTNGIVLMNVLRDKSNHPVDFQATTANPSYCTGLNVTLEELTSQSFLKVFEKYHIETQGFPSRWWGGLELAANGISGTYHSRIPELITAPFQEIVAFPVGNDQVGMLMYDETYRIRSEQQLKLMQLIIDSVSQPVFWLFLEGTIQYANDAAARAWGFENTGITPDGPIGEKVWMFDTSVSSDNWSSFNDMFKDATFQRFDTTMRRADGTTFPAVVTVNLLEQNNGPFYAACFQDLTDQTERIKAEQKALAKASFLDHMTHEIRTPLNGVIGIFDLMLKTIITPRQQEYLEMGKISGEQLLTIVSNILDFSMIDSNKLKLQTHEFDLWKFVEYFRKLAPSMIANRTSKIDLEFTVQPNVPQYILGDKARLRQVVFNLIDNALKFTQQGKVAFDLSLTQTIQEPKFESLLKIKDDKKIEGEKKESDPNALFLKFRVSDTGCGISKEKLNDLFDSFVMGDASFSRKYGGTGLGLPISRGLVHKMNGEVYVSSEIGVGSTFEFVIPLKQPEKPRISSDARKEISVENVKTSTSESEPKTADSKTTDLQSESAKKEDINFSPENYTVLVVEDNRINRIVTGEILKQAGYHYEFAENGLQACETVAAKKFDLVLMDCQMPIMDGFEATRRIRKMENGEDELHSAHKGHIPIVALTANALVGDEQHCFDAGMDAFCSKPTNAEQLLKVIRQWITIPS